ncbi:1-deoxy-D-xylulose 5-phosphate reductoisomerase [Pirellula sp. SH-Sr6A]|uniref:1-deoxy-D-xylulose-5-phosphate reductoisomerase n=1 Tax=Pirellula sp. SH-Sr6A TaxID=1632865 RepID=UPI00078BEE4E|nr:1-deoxy-D-xylulose-5-phosphate reductoisomerase [Pirellula sp. SH-Sr6A]AMV34758.1 1-deoxy-D-xylulose 5-phosphate reductoisomerase [Pirellula sp. SH-Sr6A]
MGQIRNVAVLGSTGSIGRAALDVLDRLPETHRTAAISCHSQLDLFETQIEQSQPLYAVVTQCNSSASKDWHSKTNPRSPSTQRFLGSDAVNTIVSRPEIDTVVGAIVGVAGLQSALRTVELGKRLALANKESLVVAGSLIMGTAKTTGAEVLPVDSEHSAIFQCLQTRCSPNELKRVILTASGGPLRDWPLDKLEQATVEDALMHPTWQMGRKITVDSATMMNKALEVIEAKWLFDLTPDQIHVVIHSQSIIHSMVEFRDASVIAQLSPPDMRLPIQYALTYPERAPASSPPFDWNNDCQLSWKPVDPERYPCLQLGFEVAARGGSCGAVLNAANEACVELFLERRIRLTDIAKICKSILHHHHYSPSPSLPELLELDCWSRLEVQRWIT